MQPESTPTSKDGSPSQGVSSPSLRAKILPWKGGQPGHDFVVLEMYRGERLEDASIVKRDYAEALAAAIDPKAGQGAEPTPAPDLEALELFLDDYGVCPRVKDGTRSEPCGKCITCEGRAAIDLLVARQAPEPLPEPEGEITVLNLTPGAVPEGMDAELKKACDQRDAYEISTVMLSRQLSELAAELGTEEGNFNAMLAEIRRLRASPSKGDGT